MKKYNLKLWQQICCYLAVSITLFVFFLTLGGLFHTIDSEGGVQFFYPLVGGMLFSLLLVRLYVFIHLNGVFKFLSDKAILFKVNFLLAVICCFIAFVAYTQFYS